MLQQHQSSSVLQPCVCLVSEHVPSLLQSDRSPRRSSIASKRLVCGDGHLQPSSSSKPRTSTPYLCSRQSSSATIWTRGARTQTPSTRASRCRSRCKVSSGGEPLVARTSKRPAPHEAYPSRELRVGPTTVLLLVTFSPSMSFADASTRSDETRGGPTSSRRSAADHPFALPCHSSSPVLLQHAVE